MILRHGFMLPPTDDLDSGNKKLKKRQYNALYALNAAVLC